MIFEEVINWIVVVSNESVAKSGEGRSSRHLAAAQEVIASADNLEHTE